MHLNQVTVPALDVPASVEFYRGLGLTLIVNSPRYARFECSDGGATFSVHLADKAVSHTSTVVYFECQDLDDRVSRLKANGYSFTQEPQDQPWLWREARLLDPAGNPVCLYWAGKNRRFPPWRIPA